jgi:hypothetical protein
MPNGRFPALKSTLAAKDVLLISAWTGTACTSINTRISTAEKVREIDLFVNMASLLNYSIL